MTDLKYPDLKSLDAARALLDRAANFTASIGDAERLDASDGLLGKEALAGAAFSSLALSVTPVAGMLSSLVSALLASRPDADAKLREIVHAKIEVMNTAMDLQCRASKQLERLTAEKEAQRREIRALKALLQVFAEMIRDLSQDLRIHAAALTGDAQTLKADAAVAADAADAERAALRG